MHGRFYHTLLIFFLFFSIYFQVPSVFCSPVDEIDFNSLPHISTERYFELRNIDPVIFGDRDPSKIFSLSVEIYEALLLSAERKHLHILEFYFDPKWARLEDRVILIDTSVLERAEKEFDIPSLFPQSGRLSEDIIYSGKTIPKGTTFHKEAVILNAEQVITVYPHPLSIEHDLYVFFSSHYNFFRVNVSKRTITNDDTYQISNLVGRDLPQDIFRPLRASFGMELYSISCKKPCNTVRAETSLLTFNKPSLVIHRKDPTRASSK